MECADLVRLVRNTPLPRTIKHRPQVKSILLAIAFHCDRDGRNAFPSNQTIRQETELGEHTVRRGLATLEAHRLIREQAPPRQHRPRVYELNLEAIRALLATRNSADLTAGVAPMNSADLTRAPAPRFRTSAPQFDRSAPHFFNPAPTHGADDQENDLTEQRTTTAAEAITPPDREPSPTDALVGVWNAAVEGTPLKPVLYLTDDRRSEIQARLAEHPLPRHAEAIQRIARSSFCAGGNREGFVATFDWYIRKPDPAVKALEGLYDDNAARRPSSAGGAELPEKGDAWNAILGELKGSGLLTTHAFHTWFAETALVEDRGALLVVAIDERRARWIDKHLLPELKAAIARVRPGTSIEWVHLPAVRRLA